MNGTTAIKYSLLVIMDFKSCYRNNHRLSILQVIKKATAESQW